MKNFVFAMIAFLPLSSCGTSYKNERTNEDYTYSYSLNGCSTGQQSFTSKRDLCSGLLDEGRNKECAQASRYEQYQAQCEEFGSLDELLKKKLN